MLSILLSLTLLAGPAPARTSQSPRPSPCADLLEALRWVDRWYPDGTPTEQVWSAGERASAECRAVVERHGDPELERLLLRFAGVTGDRGHPLPVGAKLLCDLHPAWAKEIVLHWVEQLDDIDQPPPKGACLAATMIYGTPEALSAFDTWVRYRGLNRYGDLSVDEGLLQTAERFPPARARLNSLLGSAYAERARGYDQLHLLVCTDNPLPSCSRYPGQQESAWRVADRAAEAEPEPVPQGPLQRHLGMILSLVIAAAIVVFVAMAQQSDSARLLAMISSVLGFGAFGLWVGGALGRGGGGEGGLNALGEVFSGCFGLILGLGVGILGAARGTKEPGPRFALTVCAAAVYLIAALGFSSS